MVIVERFRKNLAIMMFVVTAINVEEFQLIK